MIDLSKKYKKEKPENMPHIGNFINYYIVSNKLSKTKLTQELGVAKSTLNQYYKNESLQLAIIWKISKLLNHNFIAQLSEYLHIDFKTKQQLLLEEEIAALQKKVETLEIELAIYKKIQEK